jgi:hypothetical protein
MQRHSQIKAALNTTQHEKSSILPEAEFRLNLRRDDSSVAPVSNSLSMSTASTSAKHPLAPRSNAMSASADAYAADDARAALRHGPSIIQFGDQNIYAKGGASSASTATVTDANGNKVSTAPHVYMTIGRDDTQYAPVDNSVTPLISHARQQVYPYLTIFFFFFHLKYSWQLNQAAQFLRYAVSSTQHRASQEVLDTLYNANHPAGKLDAVIRHVQEIMARCPKVEPPVYSDDHVSYLLFPQNKKK